MKLFIARHGEASFNAPSDRERPLTQNGLAVTARLADKHMQDLQPVSRIWCSDLVRAKETASIYAEILSHAAEPKSCLAPDCEPEEVLEELQSLTPEESLLIVSHQPLIGDLVSFLCVGNVYESHPFMTSEIVVLECETFVRGTARLVSDFRPT